jgi:hypothetical protein
VPQDVIGDTWGGLCDLGATSLLGPIDLFSFQYRGAEPVDPSALAVVVGPGDTYVYRQDGSEPQISVGLSGP